MGIDRSLWNNLLSSLEMRKPTITLVLREKFRAKEYFSLSVNSDAHECEALCLPKPLLLLKQNAMSWEAAA